MVAGNDMVAVDINAYVDVAIGFEVHVNFGVVGIETFAIQIKLVLLLLLLLILLIELALILVIEMISMLGWLLLIFLGGKFNVVVDFMFIVVDDVKVG